MSDAYLPRNWALVAACAALMPVVLGLGYLCMRVASWKSARLLAWGLVLGSGGLVHVLSLHEPAGLRMLLLCGVVLFAMKSIVAVEERRSRGLELTAWEWLQWAGMWPGMRPDLFAGSTRTQRDGAGALVVRGLFWIVVGAFLLYAARIVWQSTHSRLYSTILLLPAISLLLHFGLFNLLSGGWRRLGVDVERLFPAPLLSTSLGEFWGKRWNLPFTEMIQRAVYRPLCAHVSKGWAALAGFFFSGLLHEMAISLPVKRGFGLPMLYFVLHGGLVVLERKLIEPRGWFLKRPWLGRVWTIFWLAAPMPILFHSHFLQGILWPMLGS